jgi:hypothetical protein
MITPTVRKHRFLRKHRFITVITTFNGDNIKVESEDKENVYVFNIQPNITNTNETSKHYAKKFLNWLK